MVAPTPSLQPWVDAGVLGPAEVHGAAVLARNAGDDAVELAAALALWAPLHGHACIDLVEVAAVVRAATRQTITEVADDDEPDACRLLDALVWPSADAWAATLRASDICRVADDVDPSPVHDERSLVLHGTRVYTQRQWADECAVATDLRARAVAADVPDAPDADAERLLDQLLPSVGGEPNQQRRAAELALGSQLAIVVGGPGTGKTHTIARMLAAAIDAHHRRGERLRIALAAPTGKAAARMSEAIRGAIARLDGAVDQSSLDELALLAPTTIHRLLGARRERTRFDHDRERPLEHDLVVVDEASMIALPLMARLLEALRPEASLVLVGDPDQLESIEVGSVLADIVLAGDEPSSPLHRHVVRLDRAHRQAAGSPIGPLADAVRSGDARSTIAELRRHGPHGTEVAFFDTDRVAPPQIEAAVREAIVPGLDAAATAARVGPPADALRRSAEVRVLCAHRRGPFGVERWNRLIESWVLVDSPAARPPRFYAGRPLLATRNDQRQRIANGDTGIVVDTEAGLRAAFATASGVRLLAPAQLDTVETAYAMTIHKSQGSEYDTVVVVLPPPGSALLGRELLYTAITRSTRRLLVVGSTGAIAAAVERPSRRVTGLADALR